MSFLIRLLFLTFKLMITEKVSSYTAPILTKHLQQHLVKSPLNTKLDLEVLLWTQFNEKLGSERKLKQRDTEEYLNLIR